ncbi:MAG TPA: hypothetical protein VMS76_11495 [Planctomycetota bacterium]|nr:hypothetical protein [Planctomycetota bacterium]
MSDACTEFRARLERLLAGRPESPALDQLTWHEHLAACEACSNLLVEEEAFEALLETLPEPSLPPELAQRVLLRLESARRLEGALDALLDLAAPAPVPEDLAGRLLQRLSGHRAARDLDGLLQQLPAPRPPADLARRLIARLEPARRPAHAPLGRSWSRAALLAASLALALGAGWWWIAGGGPADALPRGGAGVAQPESSPRDVPEERETPSDELLASLELLENWDLLTADDLDVLLAASFDTLDEVLLDVDQDSGESEPAPKAPSSKG